VGVAEVLAPLLNAAGKSELLGELLLMLLL
jgi:hypothetical protein